MRLLKETAFLLAAAGVVGIAVNLVHPRGYAPCGRRSSAAAVMISAEEARIKHDSGAAVFVDARERTDFERGRIPGAVNVPVLEASAGAADLSFLSQRKEAVLYCDGASCGAAARLAEIIRAKGYRRTIYVIGDGFPGWEAAGGPVETGR